MITSPKYFLDLGSGSLSSRVLRRSDPGKESIVRGAPKVWISWTLAHMEEFYCLTRAGNEAGPKLPSMGVL